MVAARAAYSFARPPQRRPGLQGVCGGQRSILGQGPVEVHDDAGLGVAQGSVTNAAAPLCGVVQDPGEAAHCRFFGR